MLQEDFTGRWNVRSYSFIAVKDGKYVSIGDSQEEAATVEGVLLGDPDSLCNLAVKLEEGDFVQLFKDDESVEAILKTSDSMGHWGGSYNLGIFYLNRDQKELGGKYIDRAIELRKKSEQK